MKKRLFSFLILPLLATPISCGSSSSGGEQKSYSRLHFERSEYQIHSGERINVQENYGGIIYSLVGDIPDNVYINHNTGVITFDESVTNNTQVLLVANYNDSQSDPVIVTLLQNSVTTSLTFHTPIKNIINGDYILVSSSNNTAIKYSLKHDVLGVSIDSMTGRISYNSAAVEGSKFVVVATSAGVSLEEEYNVAVEHLAISATEKQAIEDGSNIPATYVLDFSDTPSEIEESVLAVMNDNKAAREDEYTYNSSTHVLVIKPSFIETFKSGSNRLKIITPRNIITTELIRVTKFIRNAHDLQSINDNRESLAGYYILENDIDLTDYLALGGEGYNDCRGWNQIGIYHDLEVDPERDSFTGTFDGNGHVISGFFEDRADDLAHNEGLFGYVTNQATIMNTGFVGSSKLTKGRNFIGGFVGFNEGIIKNCWVDVNISNAHEDKIFHDVGAFAGANTGTIESCYSLGNSLGDNNVGAFVGKNFGEITNCFAINNAGDPFVAEYKEGNINNCKVFTSFNDMKGDASFDYVSSFNNKYWDIHDDKFPTLKSNYEIDYVNGLEIANKNTDLYLGEELVVDVTIHPNDKQEEYLPSVIYTVENIESTGITQNGNKFDTSNAIVDSFIVTASIETSLGNFASSKEFKISVEPETIDIVDDLPTYVEPGKQYRINVNITPNNAVNDLTWEVLQYETDTKAYKYIDAFFTGNVLTLKESIMNYHTKDENPTFAIRCTSKNGVVATKTLTLKRIKYLSDKYCKTSAADGITQRCLNFYKNSSETYAEFVLPDTADMGQLHAYKFSKEISVVKSGHKVRVPIELIKAIPNRQVTFTFRCGFGNSEVIYRGYACYIDHNRYIEIDVPTQYIPLYSAQDFYNYFRLTLDDTDVSKYANYDKTYVLMNDIDFDGAENLVSIGYQASKYEEAKAFSGKIYGFGHTIKNASFHWSERYYFEGPYQAPNEDKAKRDPNTNRVGFFGYFSGEIYDVVFDNITCLSYNYGGAFAGEILTGGYLEDVVFIHSNTRSTYTECDFTIDDLVQGRIAAKSAGTFVGVSYNGTAVGLIG